MRQNDVVTLNTGRGTHSMDGRKVIIIEFVPFSKASVEDLITGKRAMADVTWLHTDEGTTNG